MAAKGPEEINPFEHYEEELQLIRDAMGDLDDLYEETKEHFDEVKNARIKGSLTFLGVQTANLITLKNSKVSLLKERVAIKKAIADLDIKKRKADEGDNKDSVLVHQLFQYLVKMDRNSSGAAQTVEDEDAEDADAAIEARISQAQSEGLIQFTENERPTPQQPQRPELPEGEEDAEDGPADPEGERVVIAVRVRDKKWSFVAVNEYGEILEGHPLPDKTDYKMRLVRDEGELIAVDQHDRVYKVIRA